MHVSHFMITRFFKLIFWLLSIAVAVLSLLPADQLPPQTLNIWDKAQHALGFAALTVSGMLAYPHRQRVLVSGLLAFGAAIECAQASTTWRQGDVLDWLADAVGIVVIVVVARLLGQPAQKTA